MAIEPGSAVLKVSETVVLIAKALDASGNMLVGRSISWSSSNVNVATVSTGGMVTAVAPGGPVIITAASEGKTGTAQVSVIAPVASVIVSPTSTSLLPGATATLAATPRK